MKQIVQCLDCRRKGDGYWAGWHKRDLGHEDFILLYGEDDEPPSENGKSIFKLHLLDIRSLCSVGFGGWGNTQSHYPFRGMVHLCVNRRNNFLVSK